jgi:hypothetical protein
MTFNSHTVLPVSPAAMPDRKYDMTPQSFKKPRTDISSLTQEITAWPSTTKLPEAMDFWELYSNWATFSSKPISACTPQINSSWIREKGPSVWFTYLDLCLHGCITHTDRFAIAFTLPTLAFRSESFFSLPLVRAMLLIATHAESGEMRSLLNIPQAKFDLKFSPDLEKKNVKDWAEANMVPRDEWDHGVTRKYRETPDDYNARVKQKYDALYSQELESGVNFVWNQWRRQHLHWSGYLLPKALLRPSFKERAISEFSKRYLNGELRTHAHGLAQIILQRSSVGQPLKLMLPLSPSYSSNAGRFISVNLQSVMHARSNIKINYSVPCVSDITTGIVKSDDNILASYLDDLRRSALAAEELPNIQSSEQLTAYLQPQVLSQRFQLLASLWPPTNPLHLLRQLAYDRRSNRLYTLLWQERLSLYARSLLDKQQSLRLFRMAQLGQRSDFAKELSTGSIPPEHIKDIDWLLIQLDGDFAIRQNQDIVAKRMMHPTGNQNLVTQLNMGEGKTSVSYRYLFILASSH